MKRNHFLTFILIFILLVTFNSCAPSPSTPVITYFSADPPVIDPGGTALLSWQVSGATTATITPGVGTVALSGTIVVSP